jgi:DNA-binding transcriptional ArsR family regulator
MRRRKSCLTEQLSLIDPPPVTPGWKALPEDARREVTRLLAALVREHASRVGTGEEAADE